TAASRKPCGPPSRKLGPPTKAGSGFRRSVMRRDDVLQHLQRRPFQPFRLRLSNGIDHDIRHPEMAIVTPSTVVVGIPASAAPVPSADNYVIVSLLHVVQIEPLAPAAPPGVN